MPYAHRALQRSIAAAGRLGLQAEIVILRRGGVNVRRQTFDHRGLTLPDPCHPTFITVVESRGLQSLTCRIVALKLGICALAGARFHGRRRRLCGRK